MSKYVCECVCASDWPVALHMLQSAQCTNGCVADMGKNIHSIVYLRRMSLYKDLTN